TYHTGRFTKVPRLAKLLRVPTPADRGLGQPWRPGTPPPAPIPSDTPTADIRVGYARCSHLTQELQSQLDALAAHGIGRDKIFAEKVSTRVRVRPKFEAALDAARQIKAHAPHCRVILTVYEMKRLGRDSAELTALADHLTAHGIALEMLAGPLTGIYDPSGTGRVLFAFFAAMAETERENIREATLRTCRQIKAHAPHCRVILTVYEMKRLGRDSAELTALADHLTAHGIALEMLAGPLTGIYDPTGTGRVLFAFFAAMAETERENIREATLEGLNAAARKGHHGGRPPVITEEPAHRAAPPRRRRIGESIRPDLIIPTGKRRGRNPSLASIYRALAEHAKRQAYPQALEQAHADFAALKAKA
ncbi:MAG TPA: recombinase family protein, partial [Pseudonocardiaceae bacterium]|nr:recombinase family protein [Pseudonocardiaceae bacterium]